MKHTSESCDAVIVGGDFNFRPEDPSFRMALANSNLQDAWTQKVRLVSVIFNQATFIYRDVIMLQIPKKSRVESL